MSKLTTSRRDLLLASAGLLGVPALGWSQAGPATTPKKLIVVFAEGGWDVTFCMDPKLACQRDHSDCIIEGPEVDENPDDPDDRERIERFGDLEIMVNDVKRPAARQFFRRWHPRIHVVNGVWTGSIAHDPCRYRILTGTPDGGSPDLATIAGFVHGGELPLGSVDLSGWGIAGPLAASSGRIGASSQIAPLLDDARAFRPATQGDRPYPLFRASEFDEAAIDAFLRGRASRVRRRFGDGGHNDSRIDDLERSVERAQQFRSRAAGIMDSLGVGQQTRFREQMKIGVNLIEAGLCHAITVDTRNDWDSHDQNAAQHRYYEDLFQDLWVILDELDSRQLLDDYVIAVVSEMTRTPVRNAAGGKDHWGHTSAMLMGAVRGNAVSGGTDQYLESLPVHLETGELRPASDGGELIKYDNLVAGILELSGVEPERWLPGVMPFRGAHVG